MKSFPMPPASPPCWIVCCITPMSRLSKATATGSGKANRKRPHAGGKNETPSDRFPHSLCQQSPHPVPGVQTCALPIRSEEHTSELQSHLNLVSRLLLEKNK